MDIEKLVSNGESDTLEFKESLSLKDEIGEGVSALSNTSGGMILVGVTDSREIIGVEIGKKTLEDLANYS
ncbi:MAG: ATP-binding protein [archaeon]